MIETLFLIILWPWVRCMKHWACKNVIMLTWAYARQKFILHALFGIVCYWDSPNLTLHYQPVGRWALERSAAQDFPREGCLKKNQRRDCWRSEGWQCLNFHCLKWVCKPCNHSCDVIKYYLYISILLLFLCYSNNPFFLRTVLW